MVAARSYTRLLWAANGGTTVTNVGPQVPDGELWVLRNISVWLTGQPFGSSAGFQIQDSAGFPIFDVTDRAQQNKGYEWEGRQVLMPGDALVVVAFAADTMWRMTGYIFASP